MAYSGALTADNDVVTQQITGVVNLALLQITGTFSGMTILFEASADNATWVAVQGVSGPTVATSTTTTGNWKIDITGYAYFRVRAHPVSTGTANVQFAFGVGTAFATLTSAPGKAASGALLAPNYYSNHMTTKTTITPTAATCYVSSIVYCCTSAGTAWTLQFKDKSGTPLLLTPAITLAAATTAPVTILSVIDPIICTGGIDIVSGGTTAGVVDIWVTYWQ